MWWNIFSEKSLNKKDRARGYKVTVERLLNSVSASALAADIVELEENLEAERAFGSHNHYDCGVEDALAKFKMLVPTKPEAPVAITVEYAGHGLRCAEEYRLMHRTYLFDSELDARKWFEESNVKQFVAKALLFKNKSLADLRKL